MNLQTGTGSSLRAWVARRPLAVFYGLTLLLSWGYWFGLLGRGLRVQPGSPVSHLPGLLGPMLAALLVTAVLDGRRGLRELAGRMVRGGPRWPQNLLLALSPLALAALTFAGLGLLGKPLPPFGAFGQYPGLPAAWPLPLVWLAVLVVNGFGEEVGWRGFLTERLLARQGRFETTLVVALLWSLWHLPLFWLNASMTALLGPVLLGWLLGLLCGAFVLTQVYLAGGRSLLWVAVWHAAYNLLVATPAGKGLPAALLSTLVMVWGAALALRWRHQGSEGPRLETP